MPAGFAQGQLLAQLRPGVTTPVNAFSVAADGLRTEITLISAAVLAAGNKDITLYHDDDGTTFDLDSVLFAVQRRWGRPAHRGLWLALR